MENFEEIELVDKIKKEKCVTFNTIENYFSGKNFKEIRDWLEIHNIDRHIAIELKSAGIIKKKFYYKLELMREQD